MIPVYVARDTPTYGASRRPAAISSTSTQPVARNVSAAATGQRQAAVARAAAGRASDKRGDFPGEPLGECRHLGRVGHHEVQGDWPTPSASKARTSAAISSAVPRIA